MIDLNPLICKIRTVIEQHKTAPGQYTRFTLGSNRPNPYGCADAANILYSLDDFPVQPEERAEAVKTLQSFQDPATGLFQDIPEQGFYCHHPYHTTAHCTAALDLLNVKPLYSCAEMEQYLDFAKMEKMLDGIDWIENPWPESHKGAGVYSSLVNTGLAGMQWRDRFFDYLDRNADPEYGMSRKDTIQTGKSRISHHLNGWFHYLFCYHHANRPFPYPEKLIDTCLELAGTRSADEKFGETAGFQELDWVFPLNRASRQTPYRFAEIKEALFRFAEKYIETMTGIDPSSDKLFDDLHSLFGMVCCVSELYLALPGVFKAEKPLRNVLDRRPFV